LYWLVALSASLANIHDNSAAETDRSEDAGRAAVRAA